MSAGPGLRKFDGARAFPRSPHMTPLIKDVDHGNTAPIQTG
jgi:hypothetical protein